MFITFSGIVGSGKSTNAKQAYRFLQESAYPVVYLRFRHLTARKILRAWFKKKKEPAVAAAPGKPPKRRSETSLRQQAMIKLTLARTMGYLWRIIMLRLFLAARLRRKIVIIDRFYYDSFVHYTLSGYRERFYLSVLKRALPTPNLALLLIARPQTILRRRPNYDETYVLQLYSHYKKIIQSFPHLVVIKTDNLKELSATITAHIRQTLARAGEAAPRPRKMLQ
ncbi:MAG: Thymidylate kinase [bacterium]|nr:Thymidylate kinase [bacterium]